MQSTSVTSQSQSREMTEKQIGFEMLVERSLSAVEKLHFVQ